MSTTRERSTLLSAAPMPAILVTRDQQHVIMATAQYAFCLHRQCWGAVGPITFFQQISELAHIPRLAQCICSEEVIKRTVEIHVESGEAV